MTIDLNAIMRRITGLLAKAESSEFPEEAKSLRAKAEELLAKYRLEEEELIAESGEILPIFREIPVTRTGAEFQNQHYWLFQFIAKHCGVRFNADWKSLDGKYGYVAGCVGYDVDIRLLELIFSSALLVFAQCLEPEIDPRQSDAENVYRLRSAGIPRNRIANLLWGASMGSDGAPAHGKVGRLYKEECERRGVNAAVSGRAVNAKTYRAAYADHFTYAFDRRLTEARDAANAAVGALVPVGRAERVEEAFYTRYPNLRPKPATAQAEASTATSAKSKELTKAELARLKRRYYGPAAQAASGAAKAAAAKVRLDRAGHANRLDESAPSAARPLGA
jgi:hypothetical protein